jgi:glucose/mannose-6-phosphate isomerase
MMNLDDEQLWAAPAVQTVLAGLTSMADELWRGWQAGQAMPWQAKPLQQVLVVGIGEAGLAADAFAELAEQGREVLVLAWRRGTLPLWAQGEHTLVICLAQADETEVRIAWEQARAQKCNRLLLGDGMLVERFAAQNQPVWRVGASLFAWLGALLALAGRNGWLTELRVEDACALLMERQGVLLPETPVASNSAKRMAGQLIGRQTVVVAGDGLRAAAQAWKEWINRYAKNWAQVAWLPELDEDGLAATCLPTEVATHSVLVFLRSANEAAHSRLRADLTREAFLMEGVATDFFDAAGDDRLAQLCSALQFGAFTALYLALAQGVDPTPSPLLAELNAMLDGSL